MQKRPIYTIAQEIRNDWKNVNYAAVPYLDAMFKLGSLADMYGAERGDKIVLSFLTNAANWRGAVARRIKIELNGRLKDYMESR